MGIAKGSVYSVAHPSVDNEYLCTKRSSKRYVAQHNPRDYSARIRRGIKAEMEVLELLERAGRKCQKQNHQAPYDILCDGWRLDVKTAAPTQASGQQRWSGGRWLFNLHHSGRKITSACDFFVLRMLEFEHPHGIQHLLLRAPFHSASYVIYSSSVAKHAGLVEAFERFTSGQYRRGQWGFEFKDALPEIGYAS